MASSSSSTPPPSGETSYTAMQAPPPETDLESIGAHCQFPYCHQLDFLPFRCDSCHGTFCLDHRTETSHKCAHAGEWARNRRKASIGGGGSTANNTSGDSGGRTLQKPNIYTGQQCSDPRCKTLIHTFQNTGVHCQTCNRDYCLKHRFGEEHNCKNLTPLGARPAQQTNSAHTQAKLAFSKLRSWSKDKSSSLSSSITTTPSIIRPKPTSASARAAALATLKRTAKGDSSLPSDRRVYLHVEAAVESPSASASASPSPSNNNSKTTKTAAPNTIPLFIDKKWTVGRLLDDAAKRLQIRNENNSTQGEEGRLRVYYVEGGRVLEFSERVGEVVGEKGDGGTVVLLRGVGQPG